MSVHLESDIEAMIRRDLERGAFGSVDEFVEEAIRLLHDQPEWLAENQAEIARQLNEGVAAAHRGELLTPAEVRSQLDARKAEWVARQKRA